MKFSKKFIYVLVSHEFIGVDHILFASDSLESIQEWFDIYSKFSRAIEIVKTEYYEIQK